MAGEFISTLLRHTKKQTALFFRSVCFLLLLFLFFFVFCCDKTRRKVGCDGTLEEGINYCIFFLAFQRMKIRCEANVGKIDVSCKIWSGLLFIFLGSLLLLWFVRLELYMCMCNCTPKCVLLQLNQGQNEYSYNFLFSRWLWFVVYYWIFGTVHILCHSKWFRNSGRRFGCWYFHRSRACVRKHSMLPYQSTV